MQACVDQCLDAFVSAGMQYVLIYAKAEPGFCMWPTKTFVPGYDPYSIAQSDYYKNNGQPDYVKMMVDGCRARGLQPQIYFSVYDANWELRTGQDETTNASAYLAYNLAQITELLTNYGVIPVLWIDDWGWHIPETDINGFPFYAIQDLCKRLQPNCLLINNDHHHPSDKSEIEMYEYLTDGTVPIGNARPAEQFKGNRIDGDNVYITGQSQTISDFISEATINNLLATVNARNATLLLNTTPNNTGELATAELALLQNIGAIPYILSGVVNNGASSNVVLTPNKTLDITSTPATTDFSVLVNSIARSISSLSIIAGSITLTLSSAINEGDVITVAYIKGTNTIKDLRGQPINSFSAISMVNNVQLSPSYSNSGGTGDRRSMIAVTTNLLYNTDGGIDGLESWVNGTETAGSWNNVCRFVSNTLGSSSYLNFDFGSGARKVITEVKIFNYLTATWGNWQWQGSNEESLTPSAGSFVNIGSGFTAGGSVTQTENSMSANATGYRHYRMNGVSGSTDVNRYIFEFEFKIA